MVNQNRRKAMVAVAIGLISFAAAYPLLAWVWPTWGPTSGGRADALLYAMKLLVFVSLVFFAILQRLWRMTDTPDAEDVFAGKESYGWKVTQRVMSNTVEQAWMFVPAYLSLSVVVDSAHVYLLSMHVALWCTARIVFWIGYLIDPRWRAIGMDWTTGTTAMTFFWALYLWFR